MHADFHGLPAGRLARVPVLVSTKHGFNPFRDGRVFADRGPGRRRASPTSTSRSRRGSRATSPSARDSTQTSFEVVHYGIEPGPEPPPLPGAPLLAIVGRLIPIKGHDVLFRALAAVRDEIPGLRLRVVGDGPLDAAAPRRRSRSSGSPTLVEFAGRVAPAAPAFEEAELVVVPSFGEGFGMVALEAMERGRPVIASAVGGLPEIVDDGRTGLLVPSGDVDALAAAIRTLAGDPDRRAAMGAAGRVRALEPVLAGAVHRPHRGALPRSARHGSASGRVRTQRPRRARARTRRATRARSPTAPGSAPSRRTPSPSAC